MEQPCVSVIVPVHDGEAYLIEALESALIQDLQAIEVLMIDDGSRDNSAFIVEQLAASDSRLKLLRQPQSGASAARNRGIDEAAGEFLCFLDADDCYEEVDYLSRLYNGAKGHGCNAAAGCLVNWWAPDRQERHFIGNDLLDGYEFAEEGIVQWQQWQFDYGFHRFLFHRSLFEGGANRFDELVFFEDPVFLARILNDAGAFFATPRAHYLYRQSTAMRRWTTAMVLDLMKGVQANLEFSRQEGLARLHSYTVGHFDDYIGMIGLGLNAQVDSGPLEEPLRALESAVDGGLLAQAGYGPLPYRSQMDIVLHPVGVQDRLRGLYHGLRHMKNRLF